MKPNVLYAFDKCLKTIKSCKTFKQLSVAHKMMCNFNDMLVYKQPNHIDNFIYREHLYDAYWEQHRLL